jgi:hypothetical protein
VEQDAREPSSKPLLQSASLTRAGSHVFSIMCVHCRQLLLGRLRRDGTVSSLAPVSLESSSDSLSATKASGTVEGQDEKVTTECGCIRLCS